MEKDLSDQLLQQIRNCTNLAHRLIHMEHRSQGPNAVVKNTVGHGQGRVLRILAENDGLSQTELMEKLDIRPSSLGELVAKLEKSDCVERRQNEGDKRVINVFLTEKGRGIGREFFGPRRKIAETWCAGLSEEEKEQLSGLLGKLAASMEDALAKKEAEEPGPQTGFGCGHYHSPHPHGNFSGEPLYGGGREKRRRRMAELYSDCFLDSFQ